MQKESVCRIKLGEGVLRPQFVWAAVELAKEIISGARELVGAAPEGFVVPAAAGVEARSWPWALCS